MSTRIVRLAGVTGIVLGATAMLLAPTAHAAQGPVGLGTAKSFSILAGSGITNTGPTTITGDVGSFPTPSQTGFNSVTLIGTNHGGNAVTQDAKDDLVAAYNDAAGRKPVTNVPVELGGSTLLAGVYTSPTFGLTGTLTLDAKGDTGAMFIFQAGSTLIAEAKSRVVLLNGADPCRVVWQVGSSATFKTGARFVGDVLAHASITAQTAATFRGRLLARDGAVTLDTNTITNATCVAPVAPGGGASTASPSTAPNATPSAVPSATPSARASASSSAAPAPVRRAAAGTPSAAVRSGGADLATAAPVGNPQRPPGRAGSAPSAPPLLPATGQLSGGLLGVGLAMLALGTAAAMTGERWRIRYVPRHLTSI